MAANLKRRGVAKPFKTIRNEDDVRYSGTEYLSMGSKKRDELEPTWGFELYHLGIKQCWGIEKAQARKKHTEDVHPALHEGVPSSGGKKVGQGGELVRGEVLDHPGGCHGLLGSPQYSAPTERVTPTRKEHVL